MTIQILLAAGFLAAVLALTRCLPADLEPAPAVGRVRKPAHVSRTVLGFQPVTLLIVLLSAGLVLRLLLGLSMNGFEADINCFKAWGAYTHDIGFSEMYYADFFLDYPPGYLYVLYALDGLRRLFGIEQYSATATLIVKLAPILSDIASAALLWYFAHRRLSPEKALFVTGAYLFCPAVIVNSAVWGQADSFCALLLLLTLLLLKKDKIPAAALFYGAAALTKPQMLIFAPVLIFWVIRKRQWKMLLLGPVLALGVMALLSLPFIKNWDFMRIISLYTGTMDYYAYYTINAYNLWGMLGMNWKHLPETGGLLLQFGVPLATALCGWLLLRAKNSAALFAAPVVLMYTVYIFCVKMHERYLFPVLICLLLVYVFTRDKRFLLSFAGTAFLHFLNVSYVLYLNNTFIEPTSPQIVVLSFLHVVMYGYTMFALWRVFLAKRAAAPLAFPARHTKKPAEAAVPQKAPAQASDAPTRRLTRRDVFLLCAVTAAYALVAFWNLGDRQAANTSWTPQNGESAVFSTGDTYSEAYYVPGIMPADNGIGQRVGKSFNLDVSDDGVTWTTALTETAGEVYAWKSSALSATGKYIRVTSTCDDLTLNELALKKADGTGFAVLTAVSGNAAQLTDEQNVVPDFPSYMNSTYFDEIYHARTAYEHILGLEAYESTHPTLGKLIISVGIRMFGMNPFGWRFMGTLFGVLMLPVLYHLIKRLFASTRLAAVGTLLFAFDFMHYTQTRIATIDTYAVFFILLMYDAMLLFLQADLMRAKRRRILLPLLFSGVFMGLGAASKWTVAYAAVGLAVLFFGKLVVTYRSEKDSAACMQQIIRLCLWCCLFFLAIPFTIYFTAFLPLTALPHNRYDVFGRFLAYQQHMFNYHSTLQATHSFQSPWYQWPLDIRNVWYYGNFNADGMGGLRTISVLGSPIFWWSSTAAVVYAVYAAVKRRAFVPAFLCVGLFSSYLPWVLVPRCTFIYHYFTALPFALLALLYAFQHYAARPSAEKPLFTLSGKRGAVSLSRSNAVLIGFIAVHLILFCVFYPVITGTVTTQAYANALEWLPGWFFA